MTVTVDTRGLMDFARNFDKILADEVAVDIARIAARTLADARQYQAPDLTGETDAAMTVRKVTAKPMQGGGHRISAVFYGAPAGDDTAWKRYMALEYGPISEWRGGFMRAALHYGRRRARRAVTTAANRAVRKMARRYQGAGP